MNNKKTAQLWNHYLQDEIDAAYLYRILADKEKSRKKSDIYSQLANVEDRHAEAWKNLIEKNKISAKGFKPSARAIFYGWAAKKFGTGLLTKMLLREEANEVKSYIDLYKSSSAGQTKDIAKRLALDSAEHAGKLSDILGESNEPWHQSESGGLLRNVVYGFNDGLTANFGLIAGMIGANAGSHIILISGIAGMIADSLSMGSSGYLASISEKEVYENERNMEAEEIKMMPELETEELALIYEARGMNKTDAKALAGEIMKDPVQALEEKVRVELGISENKLSPFREGWITGLATAIGALIPILPFLILEGKAAIWTSFIVSMMTHFAVGGARSIFTGRGIFRSGFDMFAVGIGVSIAGYYIGELVAKYLL
jgi:VIT1/CCC1 family predicted Fe2+/Mn2+ transporter